MRPDWATYCNVRSFRLPEFHPGICPFGDDGSDAHVVLRASLQIYTGPDDCPMPQFAYSLVWYGDLVYINTASAGTTGWAWNEGTFILSSRSLCEL